MLTSWKNYLNFIFSYCTNDSARTSIDIRMSKANNYHVFFIVVAWALSLLMINLFLKSNPGIAILLFCVYKYVKTILMMVANIKYSYRFIL